MIFPSTILRTKKRLSETSHHLSITSLSIFILLSIFIYGLRLSSLSWTYSFVDFLIPTASFNENSPGIQGKTVALQLSKDSFSWGSLNDFTTNQGLFFKTKTYYKNQKNLLHEIEKNFPPKLLNSSTIVMIPQENIPLSIVIQVSAILKKKALSRMIVLAFEKDLKKING